jgi:hypothetical protein
MRRLLIGGLTALAVLLAADTVAWWWAVGRMTALTASWAEARRQEGWQVAMGTPQSEGWPFVARLRVADLALDVAAPVLPDGASFGAQTASVSLSLLHPRRLDLEFAGQMHLRPGYGPDLGFTASHAGLSVPLTSAAAQQADLAVAGLQILLPGDSGTLGVEQLHVQADFPRGPASGVVTAAFNLQATMVTLPPGLALAAMAPQIERVALDAGLDTETLTVRELALDWGNLSLTGSGDGRLDVQRQPAGQGTLRVTGAAEAIDALVAAKLVAPRAANTAKAVLMLLQRRQENGPPVVVLPLVVHDRVLQIGQIPLLRLPAINW